ncbi:MAG: CHAT domain-containing protein [Pirellulales bacterium]|nr:CHAT domain-containing protein [Pirellulales bacterium]
MFLPIAAQANWPATARSARAGQFLSVLLLLCIATSARAQINPVDLGELFGPMAGPVLSAGMGSSTQTYPHLSYYDWFATYYDGDHREAYDGFRNEAKHGRKVPQVWIDAICGHTMAGQVCEQLGLLSEALEHYNAALQLALSYSGWRDRITFPDQLGMVTQAGDLMLPWGPGRRPLEVARLPLSMPFFEGTLDNEKIVQQGGVITPPKYVQVTVQEIVRCTVLALRKRRELLGPLSQQDPLSKRVLATFNRVPAQHWAQLFGDIELAMAYRGMNRDPQAKTLLERAALVEGRIEHSLTGFCLLELGRMAYEAGDYAGAEQQFLEASLAAGHHNDYDTVEEALRWGLAAHQLQRPDTIYEPLEPALAWAQHKKCRRLAVSITLLLAENHALVRHDREAAVGLEAAKALMGRKDLRQSPVGTRYDWLSAWLKFRQGDTAGAEQSLAQVRNFQQRGSHWLFTINLADGLASAGQLHARVTLELYQELLREPTAADWARDPVEALAVSCIPHLPAYEHWYQAALVRGREDDNVASAAIAEHARRHRYFTVQPVGGRTLGLRWLLESPEARLTPEQRLERQTILARYPDYAELSQQAAGMRQSLERQPLVLDDAVARIALAERLRELAAASSQQENLLGEIALRREPSSRVFPPLAAPVDVQKSLADRQAVLSFFEASGVLHANSITRDGLVTWEIGPTYRVRAQVIELLQALWQYGPNKVVNAVDLADRSYHDIGQRLLTTLLAASPTNAPAQFDLDELVIVPEGPLWYVPFELLSLGGPGVGRRPLGERMRIRYVPTIGLATSGASASSLGGRTAVLAGKLYPRDSLATAVEMADEFARAIPDAIAVRQRPDAPDDAFGSLFRRLVVLDERAPGAGGPLDWSPITADAASHAESLLTWCQLPWRGPEQIVLPGFHTAAENALRDQEAALDGQDLFLASTSLMAAGARTVLLSRWRVAGQTAFDLAREFSQELPYASASEAWQRAVMLTRSAPLDPAQEPRLDPATRAEHLRGEHPFFWAGYLLVDTGARPETDGDDAPGVAVK